MYTTRFREWVISFTVGKPKGRIQDSYVYEGFALLILPGFFFIKYPMTIK